MRPPSPCSRCPTLLAFIARVRPSFTALRSLARLRTHLSCHEMKSRAATDMQSGSLAIWYRWSAPAKRRQSTKAAVELHVNLWRRRIKTRSNKEESFIDLGFRFRDASSVSNFRIYVPFYLEQKDIHDLGQILHHRETDGRVQ